MSQKIDRDRFSKNTQITNFLKIRAVGAELCHTDGQRDMTKLIVTSPSFANSPNFALGNQMVH